MTKRLVATGRVGNLRDTLLEGNTGYQNKPAYYYLRTTDKLPRLDEIDELDLSGIVAKVKLFDPTGSWTWYIAAYTPEEHAAFGYVEGWANEVGSIWMPGLVEFRGRMGLPIERDLHWKPQSLQSLLRG